MDTKFQLMDSKKSLGHFPFGYSTQGESDYSFIPDLNGADSAEVETLESRYEERKHTRLTSVDNRHSNKPGDSEYIQVGNVKVKKSAHTTLFEEEEDEPAGSIFERQILSSSSEPVSERKKDTQETKPVSEDELGSEKTNHRKSVVSYYLEVELINQVKAHADKKNESYSAIAAEALKAYIDKN